jgi:hypothetical protein
VVHLVLVALPLGDLHEYVELQHVTLRVVIGPETGQVLGGP